MDHHNSARGTLGNPGSLRQQEQVGNPEVAAAAVAALVVVAVAAVEVEATGEVDTDPGSDSAVDHTEPGLAAAGAVADTRPHSD